ncbi:MAG: hypothetical protein MJZ29_11905 [Bacteroidaceae bacterium]|nr:hypothetical protein [Bacteroidaceae bacterium]
MKKYLLSVIFAAIGLMTTTNVMAAAVAPSINETTKVNDDVFKFLSTALYVVDIDADGNQIDETAKAAEVNTIITITEETIVIKMGDEEASILKVTDSTDAKEDEEGTTTIVISCVDEDGANVQVVLMNKANGEAAITVHESHSAVAFLNVTAME